jgi:NADPH-dependent curcumin reductase CurA
MYLLSTRDYNVRADDYADTHEELAGKATDIYYQCCGKSICVGCFQSFCASGNIDNCPYCKAVRMGKKIKKKLKK